MQAELRSGYRSRPTSDIHSCLNRLSIILGFMQRLTSAVLSMAMLFSLTAPAFAWGTEGHRIIVDIAWDHLTDPTKQAIQQLMVDKHLADYASWADDYRRDHRETGPWHYVNIPMSSPGYDATRDCPHECVISQIHEFTTELADKSLPVEKRREALFFLIHFVGDIHQPFHAVAEARGGNEIKVNFLGADQCGSYTCNLHGVWDTSLIEHAGLTESDYVVHLEKLIKDQNLTLKANGTPEDWANESLVAAKTAWPQSPNLGPEYYETNIKVVDQRLALAGLRLATVLNRMLGGNSRQAKTGVAD
jgi:S1/P1 Nuclease